MLQLFQGGEKVGEVRYEIDPAATPKKIDLHYSSPERRKGKTRRGIYRLERNTLTVCFNINADREARPTEFEAGPNSGRYLHVYERSGR